MHALLVEGRDLAAVAAIDDADLRVAVDFAHEAAAARAEDAAVAVQHQRRAEVDVGLDALAVERAAREVHAALVVAEPIREILQRALAALVADRAVERVIDQEELEHARAAVDRLRVLRVHDHAFGRPASSTTSAASPSSRSSRGRRGTTRRCPGRGGSSSRDLDAGFDGRLQNGRAFRHGKLPAIDGQRDGFHSQRGIISKRLHWARERASRPRRLVRLRVAGGRRRRAGAHLGPLGPGPAGPRPPGGRRTGGRPLQPAARAARRCDRRAGHDPARRPRDSRQATCTPGSTRCCRTRWPKGRRM